MRTQHVGDAAPTTLDVALADDGMTITLTDGSTFPDGTYPFWIAINKDGATEEKVLCSGRTGNVLSVWTDGVNNGRGGDGTPAVAHDINEPVEHVWTASEADEANAHANTGSGAHGYPPIDDVVTLDGEQTLNNKTLHDPVFTGDPTGLPEPSADVPLVAETASFTVGASHVNKGVKLTQTANAVVTLPSNATEPIDIGATVVVFVFGSTGTVSFAAGSGATLVGTPGLKARARYSQVTAMKHDTNAWIVVGDLVA